MINANDRFRGLVIPEVLDTARMRQAAKCANVSDDTCTAVGCNECLFNSRYLHRFIQWEDAK
jgi:hypothetical protein